MKIRIRTRRSRVATKPSINKRDDALKTSPTSVPHVQIMPIVSIETIRRANEQSKNGVKTDLHNFTISRDRLTVHYSAALKTTK